MNENHMLTAAERQTVMALAKQRQDFLERVEATLAEMDEAMRDIVGLYATRAGLPPSAEVIQDGNDLWLTVPLELNENGEIVEPQ